MWLSRNYSESCPEIDPERMHTNIYRGFCFTFPTGAHSLFSLASGMGALTSSFFGSVHIPGKAENMEFNSICNISYFVYRGTRLSHPHFRYFRDKSNGATQPHFFYFSIGKAAISLMDKVPRSPQQRFSRFSTWIREQDPPDLPFSYFTQIGVLWAEKCVFSILGAVSTKYILQEHMLLLIVLYLRYHI